MLAQRHQDESRLTKIIEKQMFKEGLLKDKYKKGGMSKAEFRKRLLEDLKHE